MALARHERVHTARQPPSWVAATSIAFEVTSQQTRQSPAIDTDPFQVLGSALRPLVDAATKRVHRIETAASIDLAAVCEQFAERLTHTLGQLAARTLVTELHIARDAGRLTADSGRDRFAQFIEQTAGDLGGLVSAYPVLGRVLGTACQNAVAAQQELLERFDADRNSIIATLLDGVAPGPLISAQRQVGDAHHNGRSVSILRFGNGATVVYKPRCQRMQQFFGELVEWLNRKVSDLDLRAPSTLCRPGYGWVEFVEHLPCREVAEVAAFYRRQGALLALLYAVNGTDIHHENLIASVDQPVLVDAETLFHLTSTVPSMVGPDPAMRAFGDSVCRSSLLPQLLIGENGALDLSGLGGDDGAVFPTTRVGWAAVGTDQMRLVRQPRTFRGAQNRPRLGDEVAEPADHHAALLAGFRAGYDAIAADCAELTSAHGLLAKCADFDIRLVIRPSALYATLLDESTHPDLLRDGLDRERVFDVLRTGGLDDGVERGVLDHEISDLWAGDIPFFGTRPGTRDVYAASGLRLPELLATTGLLAACDKIRAMNELDRRFQEWLISASLAVRASAADHRTSEHLTGAVAPTRPTPERFLAHACSIGDDLVATALHDGRRANWLGLELVDGRHWLVQPLGAGLADGYLGVALFLAELGAVTGSDRYSALARKAITPIPALLDGMARDSRLSAAVGPGGLLGLGGVAYALSRIGVVLDDVDIRDLVPQLVDLLADMAANANTGQDVAAELAGAVTALCGVAAGTGLPAAKATAAAYADLLLAEAGPTLLPARSRGFMHGAAGVAHALLRFGGLVDDGRYASAGRGVLRTVLSGAQHDDADLGWCRGIAGVLAAHSALPDVALRTPGKLDDLVAALDQRPALRDSSLCHGELGIIDALSLLADTGHPGAETALHNCSARLLTVVNSHGVHCATPGRVPSPGLLTGLAGIGHGLLRIAFRTRTPSVLTMQPGDNTDFA